LRLAILADIHGNLAALKAVLDDLDGRGPIERIVNLGDCVSGPLWPAETCQLLMSRDWPTVRGNHDRAVAFDDVAGMWSSDAFAHAALSAAQRTWLGALPCLAEFAPGVTAFHGRPNNDNRYMLDSIEGGRLVAAPAATVLKRLGTIALGSRLVLCGHSHQPRLLQIEGGALVVNPGSVGCPAYDDRAGIPHVSETGSPHARYAIADVPDDGSIAIDFLAVTYDHHAAAKRAQSNGRPEWAHALATGFQK
jgi:predicted phosphodiesterase